MRMKRKFLTKTARTQNQSIEFFRNPFKLVPVNDIAEIADKFTRNEIMTSNEIRQIVGMKPSDDPKADELRNSNIAETKEDPGMYKEYTENFGFLFTFLAMHNNRFNRRARVCTSKHQTHLSNITMNNI